MKRLLIAVLLALLFAGGAGAASFDCRLAKSHAEKAICKDPELSGLDESLGRAYRTALARSGGDPALRAEQQRWIRARRDTCADAGCLREAYQARLAELADVTPAYESLPDALDHACIALAATVSGEASHCRIVESEAFGSLGSEIFRYALYCLDEEPNGSAPCELSGIALFASDSRTQRVRRWHLSSSDGGNVYAAPRIIRGAKATLLEVPVSVQGTGAFNATELFVREGDRWRRVDNTSWEKELARRLPKGLAVWKGIWPDLRTMSASTGLYHAKDANCCPTGGHAEIKLALKDARLVLEHLSISATPPR
jgi:uncharacterized protein